MENKPSIFKYSLIYGVILGLALVIYSSLLYVTNLMFVQVLGYLSFVIIIVIMYLGEKAYRDKGLGGSINYGQAFLTGLLIVVFASVISSLFTYLLYTVIDLDLVEKSLKFQEDKMIASGKYTDQQIEFGMNMARKFTTPNRMLIMGILGSAFFGAIFSLLISIFIKKEPLPIEPQAQPENQA